MNPIHLMHRAGQVADMITQNHLEPFELTPRQFSYLKAVQDGAINQTDVIDMTGVRPIDSR